jgi:hypothetical protein
MMQQLTCPGRGDCFLAIHDPEQQKSGFIDRSVHVVKLDRPEHALNPHVRSAHGQVCARFIEKNQPARVGGPQQAVAPLRAILTQLQTTLDAVEERRPALPVALWPCLSVPTDPGRRRCRVRSRHEPGGWDPYRVRS